MSRSEPIRIAKFLVFSQLPHLFLPLTPNTYCDPDARRPNNGYPIGSGVAVTCFWQNSSYPNCHWNGASSFPSPSLVSKIVAWIVTLALVLDIFGGLAGSALVWYSESVSHQRSS
jgi:hypothetical protein